MSVRIKAKGESKHNDSPHLCFLFVVYIILNYKLIKYQTFFKHVPCQALSRPEKNLIEFSLPFGSTALKFCLPWVSLSLLFLNIQLEDDSLVPLPISQVRIKSYRYQSPKKIYLYVLGEKTALFHALIILKGKLTYSQGHKKSYDLLFDKSRNIPVSKLHYKTAFN